MSADTWSMDRVVAAILADERLDDALDRCRVLAGLTQWDYIDAAQYAAAGSGACRAFALDGYPWEEVAAAPSGP
jgi:hypothetical protein